MKSLSHVQLFVTPWTVAYQAPPPMGFSRQEDGAKCTQETTCGMYRKLQPSEDCLRVLSLPQTFV